MAVAEEDLASRASVDPIIENLYRVYEVRVATFFLCLILGG